jgi:hypothetical protein
MLADKFLSYSYKACQLHAERQAKRKTVPDNHAGSEYAHCLSAYGFWLFRDSKPAYFYRGSLVSEIVDMESRQFRAHQLEESSPPLVTPVGKIWVPLGAIGSRQHKSVCKREAFPLS